MIHKIKALYDEGRGLSIRGIAGELGVSRNTVRKYLALPVEEISTARGQTTRCKKLDGYKAYLISLLQTYPNLSAVKVERKLRAQFPDLVCSKRSLRRFVHELKEQVCVRQPRYYQPIVDMVPGHQCQVDMGELRTVRIGGVETTVYFSVFVLSYSRLMYVVASLVPVDTEIFIRMHDAAFRYFGGCPKECVYDQTKLVVIREEYRELQLNRRFAEYAAYARFNIRVCEGYDPESKGKVEAGVKYVKHDGLYGEDFPTIGDLHGDLAKWLDEVANQRQHGVTGEAPRVRFDRDEAKALQSYCVPIDQSDGHGGVTRQVDRTGLISWKGNQYSVPMAYQRQTVLVRETSGYMVVLDRAMEEITRHEVYAGKGAILKNGDHYRNKEITITKLEKDIDDVIRPVPTASLLSLIKETSPEIYKDQLVGLLQILHRHGPVSAELMAWICDRPSLTATQFRTFLEVGPELMARRARNDVVTRTGDLSRYAGVVGVPHVFH